MGYEVKKEMEEFYLQLKFGFKQDILTSLRDVCVL